MSIWSQELFVHGVGVARYSGVAFDCRIIRDFKELESMAGDWQRLWQSRPQPEIFQSLSWARAWWQCNGEGQQLCVPVVYQGGRVVLILPLVQRRGTLRFLGTPEADYSDVLCSHPSPVQPLTVALQALMAGDWKQCVLENLRKDSQLVQTFPLLPREIRRFMRLEVSDTCPTIVFGDDRQSAIDSLLANKHLRRRLRKLQKWGEVVFRHIESPEEIQRQLSQFFLCHRRRCASLAKTSCFEAPAMRALIRMVSADLNPARELRFGVLELNGKPLAWSLGFQLHGKYAYYQQTFDIDSEEFGPGEILLYFIFHYASERVTREIDFLRGDEFFKRRFATHFKEILTLRIERPGVLGWSRRANRHMISSWMSIRRPVVAFVRKHQTVFRIFRYVWVWKRTQTHRLRSAQSRNELSDYLWAYAEDVFRDVVWNTEIATVFQKRERVDLPLDFATLDPEISIENARVSDLADLVLEHPEMAFPRFQQYRERIKNGDQVYLVREKNEITMLAWVRLSRQNEKPVMMSMYECWPIRDAERSCSHLLSHLSSIAGKAKSDFSLCCPDVPVSSRAALNRQGYVPRYRIALHKFLHWFGRRSVVDKSEVSLTSPQACSSCPKSRDRTKI